MLGGYPWPAGAIGCFHRSRPIAARPSVRAGRGRGRTMDTREQTRSGPQDIGTVVIGAGQAGLSTAYHLARRGQDFVVLDSYERVGDNWRCHWDSLRLYSPALVASLPGMPFPAKRSSYPTKDEMADYLESYRARFDLPVRGGVRVASVRAQDQRYLVTCTDG